MANNWVKNRSLIGREQLQSVIRFLRSYFSKPDRLLGMPANEEKQGLKARPISSGWAPSSMTISRPFRASHFLAHYPGRCPGLVCRAPSGLASTLSRALSVTLSPLSKEAGKAHAKTRRREELEPRKARKRLSGWMECAV